MSTSSLTRDTRDFPLGSTARKTIERRILEAQSELMRARRPRRRERVDSVNGVPSAQPKEVKHG
jgi:hypothetical protein